MLTKMRQSNEKFDDVCKISQNYGNKRAGKSKRKRPIRSIQHVQLMMKFQESEIIRLP